MQRMASSIPVRVVWKARHPVMATLLAGLLFELSLLAGVLASPFFEARTPAALAPVDHAAALLARWRNAMVHPWLDPHPGQPAPELALRAPAGQPIRLADLRGKKVALLFVPGGGG